MPKRQEQLSYDFHIKGFLKLSHSGVNTKTFSLVIYLPVIHIIGFIFHCLKQQHSNKINKN
ncbi:hypothetical protein HMPREF0693_3466 [Proteus mirabilis ATCC 29906]|nr:hypothetical protein HMPREF0693_3466 [Proteus mirabilis ATCC 29906]PVF72467.1 hypothetical protein CSC14_1837 [Proteus mirabilis]